MVQTPYVIIQTHNQQQHIHQGIYGEGGMYVCLTVRGREARPSTQMPQIQVKGEENNEESIQLIGKAVQAYTQETITW